MIREKIAILTNFMEFAPGYSLTGIVADQAIMLLKYGHEVHLFVNEHFNPKFNEATGISQLFDKYPDKFFLHKKTKFMHLIDYKSENEVGIEHRQQAKEAAEMYTEEFQKIGIDCVFTHDFIFTGWNLPYSIAIKKTSHFKIHGVFWFHWIHSVPSNEHDWWNLELYGMNHLIVFPNKTEIKRVADLYKTNPSRVRIIPHIKDIRTFYNFAERTVDFLERYPQIMQSEIVQVYPCSTDRLSSKKLDIVIKIFGYLKKAHNNVFLVVANQWATGLQPKENIKKYTMLAEHVGLVYGEDFVFTSEYFSNEKLAKIFIESKSESELLSKLKNDGYKNIIKEIKENFSFDDSTKLKFLERVQPYALGIDKRMLRELQLLQSVFVFPTQEESFGLVGPESAFSGALVVGNRSLLMMREVLGDMMPNYDFGSHSISHELINDENYIRAIALSISNRIFMNEAVMTKIHCRKRYNMDYLYHRCYLPMLSIVK